MTHSGQGDEQRHTAARPAHEGVVLPADGSEPFIPGASGAQAAPAGGQPWGEPWGPSQGQQQAQSDAYGQQDHRQDHRPGQAFGQQDEDPYGAQRYGQQPQGQDPYGAQQDQQYGQGHYGQDQYGQGRYGQDQHGGQQQAQGPYRPDPYAQPAPQPYDPQPSQGTQGGWGEAPEAAYGVQAQPLPPAQPLPDAVPPQALPASAPGVSATDATQFIPPVTAGALPPETSAESTTFLGTRSLPGAGAQPGQGGAGEAATQFLPPVPAAPSGAPLGIRPGTPGERQPPAEFDSLFRSDAPGAPMADATQHLPRIESDPQQPAYQQQAPQQRRAASYEPQEPESRRRKSSRVPVVAAVVVGCAVLGLGVSAVVFGGDDKKEDPGAGENVAASSSVPDDDSPKAADDPAKPQAEALDKLLADSNNSRAAVIRSVENIKQCKDLDQASTDLRGAADQRRSLVTRLQGLSVDKLPRHSELTAALNEAWKSSASADDHYAVWATQVKSKKGCKDGRARNTGQSAQGNRASGEATKAKQEASGLWNSIATKYELTERRSDQL